CQTTTRIIKLLNPKPPPLTIHPVFHVSLLKPFKLNPFKRTSPKQTVIEDKPNNTQYKVERILDSRIYCKHLQYLIKWKGYADNKNSWSYHYNVLAPEEIALFHQQEPLAPSKSNPVDCHLSEKKATTSLPSKKPWRTRRR
ncbi:retrotransposable element protein, partial [Planoprotostelium fungivorum]